MLSLTDPLIPNPQGVAFTQCEKRFIVAVAGRRSGKTLRAKRKLVRHALLNRGRYGACAPTRDQAKGLYWNDLKRLCVGLMRGDPSETELSIQLANGSEICVVGLDKPQRIEGRPWDGLLIDEFDDVKAGAWDANLRPALSDTMGFAWFIGVPEGFGNLYDFFVLGQGDDPEWASFQWPSSDVVPASELDSAKRQMDPRLYRQEYEASFEAPSGRVYEDFSRADNVRPCQHDPALPVLIGLDFNINPMSLVVCQLHGRELWAVKELEQPNSNTQRVAEWIRAHYPQGTEVWCDPSGKARQHATGDSDFAILRKAGVQVRDPGVGRESNKFNAVRAMVLNAAGERRLFVDPSCRRLISRLEQLAYDDEDDHLTDALGYLIVGKIDPVRRS